MSPDDRVVVLTMQEDPAFAREALRAGARGYVLKEAADEELVQAVRLPPTVAPTSIRAGRAPRSRAPAARRPAR